MIDKKPDRKCSDKGKSTYSNSLSNEHFTSFFPSEAGWHLQSRSIICYLREQAGTGIELFIKVFFFSLYEEITLAEGVTPVKWNKWKFLTSRYCFVVLFHLIVIIKNTFKKGKSTAKAAFLFLWNMEVFSIVLSEKGLTKRWRKCKNFL